MRCLPLLLVSAALITYGSSAVADEKAPVKDFFNPTTVWKFEVSMTPKEYQAIQPASGFFGGPPGGGGGFPGGPPMPPPKPKPKADGPVRETHKSTFGVEFPYVKGVFSDSAQSCKDVAFRYKGNGSYLPSMTKLKRNLKVEFDRYDENQRFRGIKKLNLNAGAMDASKLHEAIAYAIYRDAGVAAPRTTFAEVRLSVEGKYDKELLGLYTVAEQVDRAFLKAHFKDGKGLLMKPERSRFLDYLGDDWERYKKIYNPKHDATKEQAQRTIEFVKLVQRADEATFRKEIGSYLDIEGFLRFMAVTAMLSNMDSFFFGHNYYLYLNPTDNRFVFIPWDLDLAMAGFPMMIPPEVQLDLSLTHPYAGECKLVERLLAMKDVGASYQKMLRQLAATCFAKDKLLNYITVFEAATKDALARDLKAAAARKEPGGFDFGALGARTPNPRTFVEKRTASIAAQLDGKSKGQIPVMGFGGPRPPGPGVAQARPGDILPRPIQDMLRITPEQRKRLAEIQKNVDRELEKVLTEEQRAQWKRIRESQPGGPGGFGPPGGPPKGGRP